MFFEPEGKLKDELQATINKLSEKFDGPIFTPHVTVLARIEEESDEIVIMKTLELASKIKPLTLELGDIDGEDAYFRALYIKVSNPEVITKYHQVANQIFEMKDVTPYLPHLSLFYGNESLDIEDIADEIALPKRASFVAEKIIVYKTPGRAENWELIAEISLTK